MSAKHPDNHRPHEAREQRRKHVSTWVAATGTFALIVAMWAMLLPTQLGGHDAFGVSNAPSWLLPRDSGEDSSSPTFEEAMERSRTMLDGLEEDQRASLEQDARERAAATEADILRMKLESAAAAPTAEGVEPANQ